MNSTRVEHWLSMGAVPSQTVNELIRTARGPRLRPPSRSKARDYPRARHSVLRGRRRRKGAAATGFGVLSCPRARGPSRPGRGRGDPRSRTPSSTSSRSPNPTWARSLAVRAAPRRRCAPFFPPHRPRCAGAPSSRSSSSFRRAADAVAAGARRVLPSGGWGGRTACVASWPCAPSTPRAGAVPARCAAGQLVTRDGRST